ncbi:hypothetical protein [Streptomyces sp. NBC_01497]|uniref:hypothetical protein n=1 Tax=Streptomyces sp. NBC_01497 TaxID=2903885 RepID=UPI002E37F983|nr:hypothetical protein [Streptomyces sp. NBC_01497]
MSASSPTARSVGLILGSVVAVAAILFAAFTALTGSAGTTDAKPPRPHTAPSASEAAPGPPAPDASPVASSAPSSNGPACKLFDTECQEQNPSGTVSQEEDATSGSRAGATPRLPDPPQGTAATGGGGVLGGTE